MKLEIYSSSIIKLENDSSFIGMEEEYISSHLNYIFVTIRQTPPQVVRKVIR